MLRNTYNSMVLITPSQQSINVNDVNVPLKLLSIYREYVN